MPPKGGNAKKEGGRAKKAENEAAKKEVAAKSQEAKEAAAWSDGAKTTKASKEEKEERRKAELARKAENARLLAEEEASAPAKVKAPPKAGAKKGKDKGKDYDSKPAGPGAIAAGGVASGGSGGGEGMAEFEKEIESYSATGLDNAIDLMEVVTAKTDKASVGQAAAGLEKHPEAAYEAYKEQQLPILKDDYPGLRLQQYQDMMYKNFQKSPDNPFNQTVLAYDATKEEKLEALKAKKAQVEERLREKKS
ncbi:hypothetical protein HWV62_10625 [Athelia sp. TMB]|nr:hypothetical protein HWV62_16464 [Athelia sp. TMB]KAF7975010.1 hypothetical protein HWV62_10625 [Athelia sp. TMB]